MFSVRRVGSKLWVSFSPLLNAFFKGKEQEWKTCKFRRNLRKRQEKNYMEHKFKISKDNADILAKESKRGVQRLSGQSKWKKQWKKIKKIELLRKEPQMAGTIQPANRRANGLKETGSLGVIVASGTNKERSGWNFKVEDFTTKSYGTLKTWNGS